jgi:[pyruvate, water dikinase]-phosphate phosphotransferase / [pyruvate, water dikinase] kinase
MNSPDPLDEKKRIILLSGSTGRTVEEVVKAALAQFDNADVVVDLRANVRTVKAAVRIVDEAADTKAILFHSLVAPKVRDAVVHQTQLRKVPSVDVLGPVLSALNDKHPLTSFVTDQEW